MCHKKWEDIIHNSFGKLGAFISDYPVRIMVCCIVVNLLLTIGLIRIEVENDVETLYTPMDSQAIQDRSVLRNLYGDPTDSHFRSYQLTDFGLYGSVMILSKEKTDIKTQAYVYEINSIHNVINTSITVTDSFGTVFTFSDISAGSDPVDVISGSILLSQTFQNNFVMNNVTYPFFGQNTLSPFLANAVSENGMLTSTIGVKLQYYLKHYNASVRELSKSWEKAFASKLENIQTNLTDIAYAYSDSLETELTKNTNSDIQYFSITFALMMTYASIASLSINCNNAANRMNLGFAGILAPILAIASAFGFVSAIGVEFTNIVGVMPFLVVGIGIDDMFILMSGMADASPLTKVTIKDRMVFMMKKSGVAITITSLTDLLAFAIGATSVFKSIRNFCIYTGVSVFFCYLNQLFFFCPAMRINEQRTKDKRHFCISCKKVKRKEDYVGKSKCFLLCVPGSIPETRLDVESPMEKYPKKVILFVLNHTVGKIVIIFVHVFLAFLGASIYGCINLQQGLQLFNLASKDSYFYKYSLLDEDYFTTEPMITLCVTKVQDYHRNETQNLLNSVLSQTKLDSHIDAQAEINWLENYKNSAVYDSSSETAFVSGLINFLGSQEGQAFTNDLVLDKSSLKILSSRFYLKSKNMKTSNEQGDFMKRMRKITDSTELPCILYTPAFVFFEQYVQILSSTFQTVGIAVAVMLVVTFIFMPDFRVVIIVCLTLISILAGIFGFMYYWDLTLSSITMIHLVMSVGFSVDFSVHICHAFISVDGENRKIILENALDRAGGPIVNAAISTLLGICMLGFARSYIFNSFGILMFLVIGFGLIHASFFLPLFLYAFIPWITKSNKTRVGHSDENGQISEPTPVLKGERYSKDDHVPVAEPLPSLSVIHLVMSVGFSVDFSVHICHAFISVDGENRKIILENALDRAGGPIVNAAISTLLGICMLGFARSYIFNSFGILMFLVIGFGLIHASFFLPLFLYAFIPWITKSNKTRVGHSDENGQISEPTPVLKGERYSKDDHVPVAEPLPSLSGEISSQHSQLFCQLST
ncbi:patched domain-containing protein 3-like [Saccostrea echinata]|uniref:patched domain-containing protein 3-like n=1 Tax=Saccostrea echinata TaxID=191078 RepID=UPI002A81B8BE|nr:patched domain-containing protein 3-like [Saccostrea echinata]